MPNRTGLAKNKSTALATIPSLSPTPIEKFRRPAQFAEVGFSGLDVFGGEVREEFLPELRGKRGIRVYKEMRDNDPVIGAVLFAVSMLIRQASWKVVPFDDTNEQMRRADIVKTSMSDMSMTWSDVMSEVLSMLPFGWSWTNVVYKRRAGYTRSDDPHTSRFNDGAIGWQKMPLRSQDSLWNWDMDDTGGVHAMHQLTSRGQRARIPITGSLLFRTESYKNNPEGRSILRNCYRPWYYKKRIEEVEGIGVERDLAGLPVITPPDGLDIWNPDDPLGRQYKDIAETLIRNIRRDEQEGVLKPFGWELELLSTGGKRNFDTSAIIGRYNNAIAMTCMADFIILGHNNRYGSKALAGNKTQMFQMSIVGWLLAIQDVFNRFEIPRMYALNGWDPAEACTLEAGDVSLPDLTELGEFIQKLAGAKFKIFPNPVLEKHLFSTAGLPVDGVEFGREDLLPQPKLPFGGGGGNDDDDEDNEDEDDT